MTNDRNILIIDDSKDMRSLLKVILESKGYEANCSSNGEEALNILKSNAKLPDLILLDLRMPIMDGFEFLKRQRENPKLKDIPVVVMSGDDETESNELTTGSALLMKPFDLRSVIATVDKFSQA